jgi:hypothetical protein
MKDLKWLRDWWAVKKMLRRARRWRKREEFYEAFPECRETGAKEATKLGELKNFALWIIGGLIFVHFALQFVFGPSYLEKLHESLESPESREQSRQQRLQEEEQRLERGRELGEKILDKVRRQEAPPGAAPGPAR